MPRNRIAQSLCVLMFFVVPALAQSAPQYPNFPSETPAKLEPVTSSCDYVRRDVMIPMRDGVKLHTVILVPKGAKRCADPADAHALQRRRAHQPRRKARISGPILNGYDNATRRHRRRRLHPRGAGRARQVRFRGRLRDESSAARTARIRRRSIMPPTPTTPSTGW